MGRKSRQLDGQVKKLGHATFADYLASEHWKRFLEAYGDSRACLACDAPEFRVYHVSYRNLGREGPADVIPLCLRCYRVSRKRDVRWREIDRVLQRHHGWDDAERLRRFGQIPGFLGRSAKHEHKEVHDNRLRSACDYPKLAKHLDTLKRYVEDGYTPAQLAEIYGVTRSYVVGYLNKFREYFPTYHAKKSNAT